MLLSHMNLKKAEEPCCIKTLLLLSHVILKKQKSLGSSALELYEPQKAKGSSAFELYEPQKAEEPWCTKALI